MLSAGMLRRMALVKTDVSEELSASIIRATRICELGATLAVTSNQCTLYFFVACVGILNHWHYIHSVNESSSSTYLKCYGNLQTYCDVFGRMPPLLCNRKLDTPAVAMQRKVRQTCRCYATES
jgi:hypothetical protein